MNRNAYWSAVAAVIVATFGADMLGIGAHTGKAYCSLRHPVEALTTTRTACEQQHVLQNQGPYNDKDKDNNKKNAIWINTVEHDYADRSSNRPWEVSEKGMWGEWGDDNLKRAYKMGVYANGYHFMVYDYPSGPAHMTLVEWDGASHVTYIVASAFNFITKELSYIGFQWHRDSSRTQYVDAALGIFVDLAEVAVGLGYGAVGVILGTIFNPLDTFFNLIGMLVYSAQAVAVGIWNTLADILSLLTLGWAQVQTANW